MSPVIRISDLTYSRLQALATPFVDTPASVIERLLDAYEKGGKSTPPHIDTSRFGEGKHILDPDTPDDLTYTKIIKARLGAVEITGHDWKNLVQLSHQLAMQEVQSFDELLKMTKCHIMQGKRTDTGFQYLPDVDISVQNVDANSAWRNSYSLAKQLDKTIEVLFRWQNVDKAAHAGETGSLIWIPGL